MFILKTKTLF